MEDGYETQLNATEVAVLKLTDAFLGVPDVPTGADQALIRAQLSNAQIIELLIGIGLFHGMSKVLINLGLEPAQMPVTLLPTPGSSGNQ